MDRTRSLWRALKRLALAAVCWGTLYGPVLAREAKKTEEKEGGGSTLWTIPYFLVILGVGLGLLVILRSSRRRDRARPQAYASGQLAEDEEEEPH
ncbi:MAG: hypothetical protein A2V70_03655 [Planctomycetes bacterium RBG_13_63_9]|nr:MAG: hypothetical protein A2V70_03655 [Planctomycetes bacterium RBG_13_63_9]